MRKSQSISFKNKKLLHNKIQRRKTCAGCAKQPAQGETYFATLGMGMGAEATQ